MDQTPQIHGFDEAIKALSELCYTHMTITLNAENYRATDLEAERAADGSVLVKGYGFDTPESLLLDTPIRRKLIQWIQGNSYVVAIVCSYTTDIDPATKQPIKEIRGFIVRLNKESNALAYERIPKDDLVRSRSLDPMTGQPVEPSSDEHYM